MEIEVKKTKGKQETVRHWHDKEIKEMHKANGYTWRSNRKRHKALPATSDEYRDNYDSIFRKDKKA